jgi:hypothetical protein
MTQAYIRELVHIAQTELPQLQYDLQNASTHMTLQAACQRLFNIVTYVVYHQITSASEQGNVAASQMPPSRPAPPPAPPAPAPQMAPQMAPAFHPMVPTAAPLPPPPMIHQPATMPSAALSDAQGANIQPGVTNVIITAQGTRVLNPNGGTTVLPPGEAVDLAAATGRPIPPPAPPGVAQVVLPPGGGLTPDVLAALSSRQGTPPVAPEEPPTT